MREDPVLDIHQSLFRLHRIRKDIKLCWVHAHEGIKGNEGADKIYKNTVDIPVGKGEGKAIIEEGIMRKWKEMGGGQ